MDSSDEVPQSLFTELLQISVQASAGELLISLAIIFGLLFLSALVSGAEVAYFSLSRNQLEDLADSEVERDKAVLSLLAKPKELLAALLIGNNFINVSIVILSYYFTFSQFDFGEMLWLGFLLQTILVTFVIVMLGEVVPKVYATENTLKMARFMSPWLRAMVWIFRPISWMLVQGTSLIDRRFKQQNQQVSIDELNQAIEMTYEEEPENPDEKDILKGIVNFGNISVKQVMIPRQDIKAIEYETDFHVLKALVTDWGYSRIPVYRESLDHLEGILYLKDLLAYLEEHADFEWQKLLRKPFFVPEKKRIDDLFRDFQTKHTHIAMVVDEYGGCSGLITLEDVLEEIVGEINDEYDDEEESQLTQIDERTYVCMGKIQLQELSKHTGFDIEVFEEVLGDADTLAGLILEIAGRIPEINEHLSYHGYEFVVTEADERRIKTVQLSFPGETVEPGTGGDSFEV
ncbi:MAG: gliding motility-associated protein GldE [Bacteroidia bacterium]